MRRIVLLFITIILLTSCSKNKENEIINTSDKAFEDRHSNELNIPLESSYILPESWVLTTDDIINMNEKNINSFNKIYDKISRNQINEVEIFLLKSIDVHSFKGTEKFENLIIIDFSDCTIDSFDELIFSNNNDHKYHVLNCYNCIIKDINSIEKLSTISELRLVNCNISATSIIKLSEELIELHLDNCKDYQQFFKTPYPKLRSLCLQNNNISNKEELITVLEQCPNIKYIYLGNNPIYMQIKENLVDMGRYNEFIFESCIQ